MRGFDDPFVRSYKERLLHWGEVEKVSGNVSHHRKSFCELDLPAYSADSKRVADLRASMLGHGYMCSGNVTVVGDGTLPFKVR